jgi:deoxyribonuclease IV
MTSFYVGAHIKKESGSLLKTIKIVQQNGGNALQLFVSNPRSAQLPNLQVYQSMAEEVREYCSTTNFRLVIHSSYTINLAKEPKVGKKTLDLKDCYWINLLMHELMVSDMLGALGVVVHVGKHTTNSPEKGLEYMYKAMSYILEAMAVNDMNTKLILETPAGAGTELLKTIDEFGRFYNLFHTTKHLGICIDTAHIWSSGYQVTEYYNKLTSILKQSAKDIVLIHYNNSKKEKGSQADVHDHIFGKEAKIPISDLQEFIINLRSLKHNPMIIFETPSDDIAHEFKWLNEFMSK